MGAPGEAKARMHTLLAQRYLVGAFQLVLECGPSTCPPTKRRKDMLDGCFHRFLIVCPSNRSFSAPPLTGIEITSSYLDSHPTSDYDRPPS